MSVLVKLVKKPSASQPKFMLTENNQKHTLPHHHLDWQMLEYQRTFDNMMTLLHNMPNLRSAKRTN